MSLPEGKFCEIDNDLSIHYHEEGAGSVLVFIHGSGPGASGYSNFKLNYPAMADAGYRVIVPDLIGYGFSSKPSDREYHLEFFSDCLMSLLDKLGVDDCVLIGNSLGGAIAISLSLRFPERVNKLILMAPGGIEDISVYMGMRGIQAMMSGFLSDEKLTPDGLKNLLELQLFAPDTMQDLLEQAVSERFPVMEQQPAEVLSTLKVPDQTEALSQIACPILGFWGMNDLFCPPSGAMKILDRCNNTRFQLLTECGHWVMVEYPELFNRECLAFLAE
ncbi:alpha/beta hydrolase [Zhongshania borealis]|uniref:Alpha/beta fold hydrolase n=1 Tax=Zhongshania borealis TaxID=889488 RepID=A0ABP7X2S8_9GAMM